MCKLINSSLEHTYHRAACTAAGTRTALLCSAELRSTYGRRSTMCERQCFHLFAPAFARILWQPGPRPPAASSPCAHDSIGLGFALTFAARSFSRAFSRRPLPPA
jgi:hypothetical protein